MRRKTRWTPGVDAMEGRALMTGFGLGGLNLDRLAQSTNLTIVADVAKIRADQTKLIADSKTSAATLRTDFKAIQAAVDASATVQAAKAAYVADQATAQTLFQADRAAIRAASTREARAAAHDQLKADRISTTATLKADLDKIQAAIDADPAVRSAQAKLVADTGLLDTDRDVLRADADKLRADLRASLGFPTR